MSSLRLLALALTLVPAFAQEPEPRADQEVSADRIVDHGYGFELGLPAEGWQLLPEADARQLVPDAYAGVLSPQRNVFAMVIAEGYAGDDLEAYADVIAANINIENRREVMRKEVEIDGRKAMRLVTDGTVQGGPFRFVHNLILDRGYAYQVLAWSQRSLLLDLETLDPVWSAFRFLPGEAPPGRTLRVSVPDTHGVGWRVRDGVYENSIFGVRVRPTEGWRVAVGQELDTMSATASVGLVRAQPEAYATIVLASTAGADPERLASVLALEGVQNYGPGDSELELEVGGEKTTFTRHKVDAGIPLDMLAGALLRENVAITINTWWMQQLAEQAMPTLPAAFAFEWMDEEERAKVAAEIASLPPAHAQVGLGFSFRNGVYRDFDGDVTWTQPEEHLWEVHTGEVAKEYGSVARLVVTAPALGVEGLLLVEQFDAEITPLEYHELAVASVFGQEESSEPTVTKESGIERRTTTGSIDLGLDVPYAMSVTSARRGNLGIILQVYARETCPDVNELLELATNALHLSEGDLVALESSATVFTDHRLGFELTSRGEGWKLTDTTPRQLRGAMTIAQMTSANGSDVLAIMACGQTAQTASPEWFVKFLDQALVQNLTKALGLEYFDARPYRTLGLEGTRRIYRADGKASWADVVVLDRNGIFYGIMATSESGEGPGLEQLLKQLKLLE